MAYDHNTYYTMVTMNSCKTMTTKELSDLEIDDALEYLEAGDELTITVEKPDGTTGKVQDEMVFSRKDPLSSALEIHSDGQLVEIVYPRSAVGHSKPQMTIGDTQFTVVSLTVEIAPEPRGIDDDLTPAIVRANNDKLVTDGGRELEEGAKVHETTEDTVYTVTELTDDTVTMTYQYKHPGEPEAITETETHSRAELEAAIADDGGTFVVLERPTLGETLTPLSEYEPETADRVVSDINSLMTLGELSTAEAWAWYGVEVLGHSQTNWARKTGRDQSTISKSVKRATDKLEPLRVPLVGGGQVVWDRVV